MIQKSKVESVKAQGDGVIKTPSGELFIPFVIQDEEVEYKKTGKDRAELIDIIIPSPYRISPICPHFMACGGCKFQHLSTEYYLSLKKETLLKTLKQRGIEGIKINDIISVPISSRRRVTFNVLGKSLGFNAYKSKKVIPISCCLLLNPSLNKLLPRLKELCQGISGDIFITKADNGFDILLTAKDYPSLSFLEKLGSFARINNVARIAFKYDEYSEAELLLQLFQPVIKFADVEVNLPIGCFLQPNREGEAILSALILKYLDDNDKVADLFCGLGSFTLPIAMKNPARQVLGFDICASAIKALNFANIRNIQAEVRNLYDNPLSLKELSYFDTVVIDPPRSGAFNQVKILADSNIKKIIYVSCNPATFARDAEVLVKNGYKIKEINPVDQFVFSHHLELVCLFYK